MTIKKESQPTFSKRELLAGAGAIAGLCVLPGLRGALAAEEWDLIVVGAGTAGLPAALFAADRGAKVLVIERSHRLGGTLDRSAGQISAAGTKIQAAAGIQDTPDAHFDDIIRISKDTVDRDLVRLFVDNAADTINWLTDNGYQPLPDHPVLTGGHEAYTARRYQWAKEGGIAIIRPLVQKIEPYLKAGRIQFLIRTDAVELITTLDGSVTGVVATDENGRKTDYRARYVALTAGGCAGNPEMYEELHGVPLYGRIAYPYNLGGGLKMGLGAGAYLRGGEKYTTTFGSVLQDTNIPSSPAGINVVRTPQRRLPWEVYVNSAGQRFVQEDNPSVDHREHALLAQPNHRYWVVFDQEILDRSPSIVPKWDKEQLAFAFDKYHSFAKADSLAELAHWTGIDAAGLERGIDGYNRAQSAGKDAEFGRTHLPLPVSKPPFYAIRMQGTMILSFAGLAVNTDLQVIRADGSPIPNLYAAGEVIGAGATTGNALVNGMMVTPALTFGRLIAQRRFG